MLAFEPGHGFRYSGVGFTTLQAIIEKRAGVGIDKIVQDNVFAPLGMSQSSFTDSSNVAAGHMRAGSLLGYAAAPIVGGALIIGLIILFARRWRTKCWRFGPYSVLIAGLGGALCAGGLFVAFMGFAAVPSILSLAAGLSVAAMIAAIVARRLIPRPGTAVVGGLVGATAFAIAIAPMTVPIRTSLSGATGNIAYSLTTNAPDLARFAIEIMRPTSPGRAQAAKLLTTPVIEADNGMRWGLGMGTRETSQGRVIWQWAGNPGYAGLLVALPEQCSAVVVLTNGERGSVVARRIVRSLTGVDTIWKVSEKRP
jgi:CubicO group peptidase (beta-lactamase class C family)